MARLTTDARRARRNYIRDRVLATIESAVQAQLRRSMTEVCVRGTHDGCTLEDCLCPCHDGEDRVQTDYRCRRCGVGVRPVVGTMMPTTTWEHIVYPTSHPADPVKKKHS